MKYCFVIVVAALFCFQTSCSSFKNTPIPVSDSSGSGGGSGGGGGGGGGGATSNIIETLVGSDGGPGNASGNGTSARFNLPTGIASDGTNLYVTDNKSHIIRKIVISSGAATTLAGNAGNLGSADGTGTAAKFAYPAGIATDGTNLYVADSFYATIRKIVIATGVVTTFAGTAASYGSTDGTGSAARFNNPQGVASDGTNLYIADTGNHTIRKIVIATGVVTTFAGTAGTAGTTDGTGTAALFRSPQGVATDGTNLYVADTGNHTIRKVVISTAVVTTLAGTAGSLGSSDGTGTAATFYSPGGVMTDGTNVYVADTFNSTIRKVVITTGVVTTLSGSSSYYGSTDGTGTAARFWEPTSLVGNGTSAYVADSQNNTIRKVTLSSGAVTTYAGLAAVTGSADGTGTAAQFREIRAVTTDGTNLYVADYGNDTIRKIVIATGVTTTLAGLGGFPGTTDGTGSSARFDSPNGITTDGTNLYVTDYIGCTIRKVVIATGVVTTLAGTAGTSGSTDGTGTAALFNNPRGIITDGTNLYVADRNNGTIRKIVIATGVVTTLAGTAGSLGSSDGTGAAASFTDPTGITTDGTNLYVTDYETVRKIVIATKVVTTLAGTAGYADEVDATGTVARFNEPTGITTDGTNLYVVDNGGSTLRQIVISSKVVTTIAGSATQSGSVDGTLPQAYLGSPEDLVLLSGNFFIANDYGVREFIP